MPSLRFDRAGLNEVERLPDGRLRVRATFSRVGPLNYLRSDGTLQQEIVTAEELFREDSLETAGLAPVTLNHPPDGMVSPKTWRKYAVGASGSTITANRVDGLVNVVFVIGDEEAIQAVESGDVREVSAGYSTLVEQRSDGKFYQTNRRYNHLALVERGRAGPEVRVHLDSAEDWAVMADDDDQLNTDKECGGMPGMMKKYKGMDMSEEVMDAFMKMEEDMKGMTSEMETMKKDMAKMMKEEPKKDSVAEEKIDALAGENAGLRTRVAALEADLANRMDVSSVEEAAQARLDAFFECLPLLPEGVKFDAGLAPIEWRKAAIASSNPAIDLDGRSDDFINGMFSTMQTGTAKAAQKADAAKAADFRRVLDAAQLAGHSGATTESPEDSWAREDAEDIAAVNALFTTSRRGEMN